MQPPQPDRSTPNTAPHASLSPSQLPGGLRAAGRTAWGGPHSPLQQTGLFSSWGSPQPWLWMGDCSFSAARLAIPELPQEHLTGEQEPHH